MAGVNIMIKDETFAGKILNEIEIELSKERVTVKEIVEARVIAEVEAYNNKVPQYFNGLVQPTDSEATINGYKLLNKKKVDAEKQVFTALNAFQRNGYFVLIDNIQAEELEDEVLLSRDSKVSFVKLTPLVGG